MARVSPLELRTLRAGCHVLQAAPLRALTAVRWCHSSRLASLPRHPEEVQGHTREGDEDADHGGPKLRIQRIRDDGAGRQYERRRNDRVSQHAIVTALTISIERASVTLLEQPLPADADDALQEYSSRIPICADEACHTTSDLPSLRNRYQAVNIKLDKTGGLTEAWRLLRDARACGFTVMVAAWFAHRSPSRRRWKSRAKRSSSIWMGRFG